MNRNGLMLREGRSALDSMTDAEVCEHLRREFGLGDGLPLPAVDMDTGPRFVNRLDAFDHAAGQLSRSEDATTYVRAVRVLRRFFLRRAAA